MKCSKTPVVVVSPAGGESVCKEYDITLRNVKEFVDGSLLEPLQERSFLIYEQRRGGHRQVAVLASLSVEDCFNGIIKRHEKVTKAPDVPGSPRRKREKVT